MTIINHPFGKSVYKLFMVIWNMVYDGYTHIQLCSQFMAHNLRWSSRLGVLWGGCVQQNNLLSYSLRGVCSPFGLLKDIHVWSFLSYVLPLFQICHCRQFHADFSPSLALDALKQNPDSEPRSVLYSCGTPKLVVFHGILEHQPPILHHLNNATKPS